MSVIYQTYIPGKADIRAYITDNRAMADLLVYTVDSIALAYGDALWYITKNSGQATSKIYFGARGQAQLVVFFVSDKGDAHWLRQHPLKNKL